jgi:diaminopimelate epimerase
MNLKGYKMDGLGNDFLIIDQRNNPINLSEDQIRHLADRNNIGFDQLIYIHSGKGASSRYSFF